jgi:hypothetical protein
MALPKIEVPTYELTLPSEDKKIKYRPFLVREEKILYIAMETGQNKEMINALKDVVGACTFDVLNVDRLPIFDIEYLFLQIRAKSVSEITKFRAICPDDGKTYVETEVDLTKVEVQVDDEHTNRIMLESDRNLGLVLKYPTLKNYDVGRGLDNIEIDKVFNILIDCIDHIFEGDKIYPAKDTSKQELKEFIEGLPQDAFTKIKSFFDTMPKLKHEVEVTNPNTNVTSKIVLTGIADFFGYASPTTR